MDKNLLQEVNELDYTIEELNEDGQPRKLKLLGIYQRSDTPNGNGRSYPKSVLASAIDKAKPVVEGRRMVGELDHPADAKVHLDKVSHIITKLDMNENGEVIGEAEVLGTPAGVILKELLKGGVKLGISSRGFGSTKAAAGGLQEVQDDYKLVTFDIVSDPSTPGAFPQAVYEHNENNETTNEDVEYTTNLEALVEDVLSTSEDIQTENKEFICSHDEDSRIYLIDEGRDSYGQLNFHVSHDYHILIRNDEFNERVSLSEENLQLIESIYGERVADKIKSRLFELGYDPKTLNLIKEED